MLELPDIRQKSNFDCGTACVKCVVGYFGYRYNNLLDRLATTEIDGTDPRAIESFFRREGFWVQSGHMTVEDLKHHLKLQRPIIALINKFGGHYVVLQGVSRGKVYYHDSADGRIYQKFDDFLGLWQNADRMGTRFECFGIAVWC